jgi:D-lactate dehydrogenase
VRCADRHHRDHRGRDLPGIERLADWGQSLDPLFDKHAYSEAILFGHALEGNLHFVFTQGFDDPLQKSHAMKPSCKTSTQLVAVEFGGSLKAEHGTGRNMAPFVELEWGTTRTN